MAPRRRTRHPSGKVMPDSVAIAQQGELDLANAAPLREAIHRGLRTAPEVRLDLRDVTFADCTVLRAIIEGAREAAARNARIVLRPSPAVDRIAELAGGWTRIAPVPDGLVVEPR